MKRLFSFFAIALFLSFPLAASADGLGTGVMDLYYSGPTEGGYYLDYDGQVVSSNFGYTTPLVEIFCVSNDPLHSGQTFTFYAINTGLDAVFGAGTFDKLARAAWVADNWKSYIDGNNPDLVKGEAQKAVWAIMDLPTLKDIMGTTGIDYAIYTDALKPTPTANSNWYYAVDSQDYLTPVPEPGILILLGIAMSAIGIAVPFVRKI
jgi:hypothetical protein